MIIDNYGWNYLECTATWDPASAVETRVSLVGVERLQSMLLRRQHLCLTRLMSYITTLLLMCMIMLIRAPLQILGSAVPSPLLTLGKSPNVVRTHLLWKSFAGMDALSISEGGVNVRQPCGHCNRALAKAHMVSWQLWLILLVVTHIIVSISVSDMKLIIRRFTKCNRLASM